MNLFIYKKNLMRKKILKKIYVNPLHMKMIWIRFHNVIHNT